MGCIRNRVRSGVAAAVLLLAVVPAAAAVLTDGPVVGGVDHQSAKVFARTDVTTILSVTGLCASSRYTYNILDGTPRSARSCS